MKIKKILINNIVLIIIQGIFLSNTWCGEISLTKANTSSTLYPQILLSRSQFITSWKNFDFIQFDKENIQFAPVSLDQIKTTYLRNFETKIIPALA